MVVAAPFFINLGLPSTDLESQRFMDSLYQTSNSPNYTNSGPRVADTDDKQAKYEEKKALAENEFKRMSQLPPRSTYVLHRIRVLSKVLHLLSLQRTASEDVELELLFAGLSL